MRGPQYERALTAMLLFVDRDDHDEFLFDLDAEYIVRIRAGGLAAAEAYAKQVARSLEQGAMRSATV